MANNEENEIMTYIENAHRELLKVSREGYDIEKDRLEKFFIACETKYPNISAFNNQLAVRGFTDFWAAYYQAKFGDCIYVDLRPKLYYNKN